MPTFETFTQLDMRAGTIIEVNDFPEAKKPAYKLTIDFNIQLTFIAGRIMQRPDF